MFTDQNEMRSTNFRTDLQFQVKFCFPMNTGLQNGTRKHTSFPLFSKLEHVVKIDYETRVVQLLRVPLFADI
jgi:hypothetical protein